MSVSIVEEIKIKPIFGNPNKFWWTGAVNAYGDASGGDFQIDFNFRDITLFGGLWLWDIQALGTQHSAPGVDEAVTLTINPAMNMGSGLDYFYRKADTVYSGLPNNQFFLGIPFGVRFKSDIRTVVPNIQFYYPVNRNGGNWRVSIFGYIYNEELEATLGSLR